MQCTHSKVQIQRGYEVQEMIKGVEVVRIIVL